MPWHRKSPAHVPHRGRHVDQGEVVMRFGGLFVLLMVFALMLLWMKRTYIDPVRRYNRHLHLGEPLPRHFMRETAANKRWYDWLWRSTSAQPRCPD